MMGWTAPQVPDWLVPLTTQRLFMTYGQEDLLNGEQASSSKRPGKGPLIAAQASSLDAALEEYLVGARFLGSSDFGGFSEEDDEIRELDSFLLENLGDPRLYVLGSWAGFSHFLDGFPVMAQRRAAGSRGLPADCDRAPAGI